MSRKNILNIQKIMTGSLLFIVMFINFLLSYMNIDVETHERYFFICTQFLEFYFVVFVGLTTIKDKHCSFNKYCVLFLITLLFMNLSFIFIGDKYTHYKAMINQGVIICFVIYLLISLSIKLKRRYSKSQKENVRYHDKL